MLRPLTAERYLRSKKTDGRAVLVVSIMDLYLDFVGQRRLM